MESKATVANLGGEFVSGRGPSNHGLLLLGRVVLWFVCDARGRGRRCLGNLAGRRLVVVVDGFLQALQCTVSKGDAKWSSKRVGNRTISLTASDPASSAYALRLGRTTRPATRPPRGRRWWRRRGAAIAQAVGVGVGGKQRRRERSRSQWQAGQAGLTGSSTAVDGGTRRRERLGMYRHCRPVVFTFAFPFHFRLHSVILSLGPRCEYEASCEAADMDVSVMFTASITTEKSRFFQSYQRSSRGSLQCHRRRLSTHIQGQSIHCTRRSHPSPGFRLVRFLEGLLVKAKVPSWKEQKCWLVPKPLPF